MSFVYGWTTDGARPSMLSPFSKMECNWLTPLVINEDGLYAIQPAELSGQVRLKRRKESVYHALTETGLTRVVCINALTIRFTLLQLHIRLANI
jgi:hypothetical protein